MFTLASFTTFLGWCSVINIGMILLFGVIIMVLRERIMHIHSSLLGVEKGQLPAIYMEFIGRYKAMTVFFNIVPYIALKIMM
jgi:hypothetical protein